MGPPAFVLCSFPSMNSFSSGRLTHGGALGHKTLSWHAAVTQQSSLFSPATTGWEEGHHEPEGTGS